MKKLKGILICGVVLISGIFVSGCLGNNDIQEEQYHYVVTDITSSWQSGTMFVYGTVSNYGGSEWVRVHAKIVRVYLVNLPFYSIEKVLDVYIERGTSKDVIFSFSLPTGTYSEYNFDVWVE